MIREGMRALVLDEDDRILPARVAALLRDLLEAGVPPEPVELEP